MDGLFETLLAALEANTAALAANTAALRGSKTTTAATAPAAASAPARAGAGTRAAKPSAVSFEAMKAALLSVREKLGTPAAKAMITKHGGGAADMSKVTPAYYAAVHAAALAAVKASEQDGEEEEDADEDDDKL